MCKTQRPLPFNERFNVNKLVRKEKTTIVASVHIDSRRNGRTGRRHSLASPFHRGMAYLLIVERCAGRGTKKRRKCLANPERRG